MKKRRTCRVCGCTDDKACGPAGCTWVIKTPSLCSACLWFLTNLHDPEKAQAVLKVFGIEHTDRVVITRDDLL